MKLGKEQVFKSQTVSWRETFFFGYGKLWAVWEKGRTAEKDPDLIGGSLNVAQGPRIPRISADLTSIGRYSAFALLHNTFDFFSQYYC